MTSAISDIDEKRRECPQRLRHRSSRAWKDGFDNNSPHHCWHSSRFSRECQQLLNREHQRSSLCYYDQTVDFLPAFEEAGKGFR